MEEKTWLDYAVAVGSIATPLLVLLLTGRVVGCAKYHKLKRNKHPPITRPNNFLFFISFHPIDVYGHG